MLSVQRTTDSAFRSACFSSESSATIASSEPSTGVDSGGRITFRNTPVSIPAITWASSFSCDTELSAITAIFRVKTMTACTVSAVSVFPLRSVDVTVRRNVRSPAFSGVKIASTLRPIACFVSSMVHRYSVRSPVTWLDEASRIIVRPTAISLGALMTAEIPLAGIS